MVMALKASQAATIREASGIVLARQPVRVAAAVEALVRGAHDEPDAAEQPADAVEHPLALDRVGLHQRPLLVVQLAGLVDDRVGDVDLADVVQQRAELGLAPHVLADAELLGDAHREVDDVLGVVAGVLVVVLEQVAQQQRGAAVGAAELDRLGDPRLALAGEDGEQRDEREHEQRGRRARRRRRSRRAGRSGRAARRRGRPRRSRRARRAAARRAVRRRASGLAERVGGELRGERGGVGGPRGPSGSLRAERDEHGGGGEREGRVVDGQQDPLRRRACRATTSTASRPRRRGRPAAARTASAAAAASGRRRAASGRRCPSPTLNSTRCDDGVGGDEGERERERERRGRRRRAPPARRAAASESAARATSTAAGARAGACARRASASP